MNIRAKVADLGLPAVVPARATGMELFGESFQIQQTRTVTTRDKSGETGTECNTKRASVPCARGRAIRAERFCESFGLLLTRGVDLGHQSWLAVPTLTRSTPGRGAPRPACEPL